MRCSASDLHPGGSGSHLVVAKSAIGRLSQEFME